MQATIEGELDKRGGKNFGPPSGCGMTVFLDDLSMPEVMLWWDNKCRPNLPALISTTSSPRKLLVQELN